MSKDIPSVNISDAERTALNALIDELENEDESQNAEVPAAQIEAGQVETKPEDGESAGETGSDANDDVDLDGMPKPAKAPMIPKARFDEAVSKERERADAAQAENAALKARMDDLEAKLTPATPLEAPKDFAAEKKALSDRYENGDIDSVEYADARDKLIIEETSFRVRHDIIIEQTAANEAKVTADWNSKMTAWMGANAEFMGNPLREAAVTSLVEKYGADASLSNEALIAKIEATAFEAFNWTGKAATPASKPVNPRDAADAAAASAAGAIPGHPNGGTGNRSEMPNTGIENIKQGQFGRLSKADQEKWLGGEGTV